MTKQNAALASKLRRYRGTRTQQSVADAAGISVRHLHRLESGLHRPTDRVMVKLADALGQPVSAFTSVKEVERQRRQVRVREADLMGDLLDRIVNARVEDALRRILAEKVNA